MKLRRPCRWAALTMMSMGVLQLLLLALGLAECQLASECADVLPSADYHTQLCTATNDEAAAIVRQRCLPAPRCQRRCHCFSWPAPALATVPLPAPPWLLLPDPG